MDRNLLIRKAFALKKECHLTDAEFDQAKIKATGMGSIKLMDMPHLSAFVTRLEKLKPRSNRLTDGQRRKILALMYVLGWQPRQLNKFLLKQHAKSNIDWLTKKEAYDMIEALCGMIERDAGRYKDYDKTSRHLKKAESQ